MPWLVHVWVVHWSPALTPVLVVGEVSLECFGSLQIFSAVVWHDVKWCDLIRWYVVWQPFVTVQQHMIGYSMIRCEMLWQVPRCATRHDTKRHDAPRRDALRRDATWHGMAWHGMAWHGTIGYGMMWLRAWAESQASEPRKPCWQKPCWQIYALDLYQAKCLDAGSMRSTLYLACATATRPPAARYFN